MQAPAPLLSLLFSEIDLDHDGWISYEVYFLFLRYYFGSQSVASEHVEPAVLKKLSADEEYLLSLQNLSAWDRFVRLLTDQLRSIFQRYDFNKNTLFELDEIEAILHEVFGLNSEECKYVLFTYFNFELRNNKSLTFEEFLALILSIYFIEVFFQRKFISTTDTLWNQKSISLQEFIALITEGCFFIRLKPSLEDLTWIFQQLDTDHDGFITFQQYSAFIRKYLGNGIDFHKKPETPKVDPNEIS
jgi:Ca2+-binding EF-hand superfamily protein